MEIHGKENLTMKTGGLLVYHHGPIPWDVLYLMSELILERGVILGGIMHRSLPKKLLGLAKVSSKRAPRRKIGSEGTDENRCNMINYDVALSTGLRFSSSSARGSA